VDPLGEASREVAGDRDGRREREHVEA
jgi:hypothetical protein